jgi:hypothetical protein
VLDWLYNEPSTIRYYFDEHPAIRKAFVAAFAATLGSEPLLSTPSTSCSEWDRAAEGQLNDELQQATVSPDTNCSAADSYDLEEQNAEPRPPGRHHLDTLYNAESTSEAQSGQSTPVPQGLQELAKNTKPSSPIRTRTKRDLTIAEISCVARSLIQGDDINFFINNYQLIYEGCITSVIGTASLTNTSINEFVIAAFDMLHSLSSHKDTTWLFMRFAYVQLIRAIDIFKAAARRDRSHSRTPRKVGHGDATIAIDTYLSARRNNSLSRAQLIEYVRKGTRWSRLAGPYPIILCIYSAKAETIMYCTYPLFYLYSIFKTYPIQETTIRLS